MITKFAPHHLTELSVSHLQLNELDLDSALCGLNHKESIEHLIDNIVCDYRIERFLTKLRKSLLIIAMEKSEPFHIQHLPVISALSLQCFNTEYIHYVSDEEKLCLNQLKESLYHDNVSDILYRILIYSCYYSLYEDVKIREIVLRHSDDLETIKPVIKRQIDDAQIENTIKTQIHSMVDQLHGVSHTVQQHYEQNPYPRWFCLEKPSPVSLEGYCRKNLVSFADFNFSMKTPETILVVGCGTGVLAIEHVYRFPSSKIIAIDLSLSSLSYARRIAEEMQITSVEFIQADIHDISQLNIKFDLIECIGVLSHTEYPIMNCKLMATNLVERGLIRASLYSQTARRQILACSKQLIDKGFIPSTDNIRELRKNLIDDSRLSNCRTLTELADFYSMTGIRDMFFHTFDRHFQLQDIGMLAKEVDLDLLGLEFASEQYESLLKDRIISFEDLHNIEQNYPTAFFSSLHLLDDEKSR